MLAQQRRQEWAIGANVGRVASSMSTSSVGVDGNSSEQHASHKSQQSAWFSGIALKPFIERGARQAEIEEANRQVLLCADTPLLRILMLRTLLAPSSLNLGLQSLFRTGGWPVGTPFYICCFLKSYCSACLIHPQCFLKSRLHLAMLQHSR